MDSILEARKVIKSNPSISGIPLYSLFVPKEVTSTDALPLIVIERNEEYDTGYSSNNSLSEFCSVQVIVYANKLQTLSELTWQIDQTFRDNQWHCSNGSTGRDERFEDSYYLVRVYQRKFFRKDF